MQCPICQQAELASEHANKICACDQCARDYGIIPMPPVTRPPLPCARCGSKKFVHCVPREHHDAVAAPMMVTLPPMRRMHPYAATTVAERDLKSGYGLLEVYICHGCGAVEWHCNGVERIPIHPHLMTELVDYDEGPFR